MSNKGLIRQATNTRTPNFLTILRKVLIGVFFLIGNNSIVIASGLPNLNTTVKFSDQKNSVESLEYVFYSLSDGGSIKALYTDMGFVIKVNPDFCPNLSADDFINRIPVEYKECIAISYQNTSYITYAVLLKTQKSINSKDRKLIIYNSGHAGISLEEESFDNKLDSASSL